MKTRSEHKLDVQVSASLGARYVPYLRKHLLAAHRLLQAPLNELSLALVNDATMSRLHKQFLNIPGPTDVLTFPMERSTSGEVTSGEVVICVSEAKRRGAERRINLERELLLYALHGMLHLAGFDDRTATGFRTMHRMEDDILTRIGVGPVFLVGQTFLSATRHPSTGKK